MFADRETTLCTVYSYALQVREQNLRFIALVASPYHLFSWSFSNMPSISCTTTGGFAAKTRASPFHQSRLFATLRHSSLLRMCLTECKVVSTKHNGNKEHTVTQHHGFPTQPTYLLNYTSGYTELLSAFFEDETQLQVTAGLHLHAIERGIYSTWSLCFLFFTTAALHQWLHCHAILIYTIMFLKWARSPNSK